MAKGVGLIDPHAIDDAAPVQRNDVEEVIELAGDIRSANADMSSVKAGEKPARRKRKVSYATFIGVG